MIEESFRVVIKEKRDKTKQGRTRKNWVEVRNQLVDSKKIKQVEKILNDR